jgi:hypothetical protein
MNDEETEARHLFAVATEDMPPGIDLLSGFDAARRRDRSRRTRRGAVLSGGVAAAAAAVTAVALNTGSAPPARAMVTSALTSTLTQSYHLSEQDTYYYKDQVNHAACAVEADPARPSIAYYCTGAPYDSNLIKVGGYTYESSSGSKWYKIPDSSFVKAKVGSVGDFTTATPQQMLDALKEATNVTATGPASGPGWTGTQYAFSGTFMHTVQSGTVTVDQQGQARVLDVAFTDPGAKTPFVTQVLTFSDFGAPVTITPPPPDQTNPWP